MALGYKYKVNVDHQFGGDNRYIKLFLEGYSGGQSEPIGGFIPSLLEYPGVDNDIYDPIFGSELSLTLINVSEGQYNEFATAKNRQYLAQVYNDTNSLVEWQGWLVPQELEEPYTQPPYETTIIFNCGLGMLNGIDFLDTDGSYYTGRATEISILAKILAKIYPSTLDAAYKPHIQVAIGLWEDGQSASIATGTMDQTYIDQEKYINDDGTVKDCLTVVREIVGSYRARISMGTASNLACWMITRIRDLALFYDSYNIHYLYYTELGAYSTNYYYAKAELVKTITGVQARSTMVGWIGGNNVLRHERSYKLVKLILDHGYRNIINAGDFKLETWDDFWTVSGTVVRVQSPDDPENYAARLNPAAYIQQSFSIEGTAGSPEQILVLSFEAMVTHDNSYTTIAFGLYMTRDTGSVQYLVGQIGGASPVNPGWQAGAGYVYFTDEDGLPESGVWQSYEIVIPYFPSTADVVFRLTYPATAGSGSITGAYYRNVKLYGTYDEEPPGTQTILQETISPDNILELKDENIGLSDIILSGNEGLYFRAAKTLDAAGATPTDVWMSYRYNGGARTRVGPDAGLLTYALDSMMIQYGMNRKRITGQLNVNTYKYDRLVIEDDGVLYLPTALKIDLKRGEVDASVVQIPDTEAIGENLITGWTNTDWGTFSSSGTLISSCIGTTGQTAESDETFNYEEGDTYEFVITYDAVGGAAHASLQFGSDTLSLAAGTGRMTPSSSGSGSDTVSLVSGTSTEYTNLVIEMRKVYGY